MTSESIIAITLLIASALTSGFFAYMHSLRRQAYLMLWSAGWCLLALHYLSPALEPWVSVAPVAVGGQRMAAGRGGAAVFQHGPGVHEHHAVGPPADRRGRRVCIVVGRLLPACGQSFRRNWASR